MAVGAGAWVLLLFEELWWAWSNSSRWFNMMQVRRFYGHVWVGMMRTGHTFEKHERQTWAIFTAFWVAPPAWYSTLNFLTISSNLWQRGGGKKKERK